MLSNLYKAYLPRRSERTSQVRSKGSNIPPVTEIGGDIDDGNTATDVSIIKMTPTSLVSTKSATISINRSTPRVTRSTTIISSQIISYTRNFILNIIRRTRSKR